MEKLLICFCTCVLALTWVSGGSPISDINLDVPYQTITPFFDQPDPPDVVTEP